MALNQMHLSVPDVAKARAFYENFFAFKFSFDEMNGELVFLKDPSGFLLALHKAKDGETIEMPSWFHFGFCVGSVEEVSVLHGRLKTDGVEMARDLQINEDWANFYCWAPGPYKLEVSWDRGET